MTTEPRRRARPTPGFQTYMQDINGTALLSAREESDLADRIAAGDVSARDHLVRANLRMVVNLARGYLGRGLPLEDLIAEGNLGLLRAVEGFDGGREIRFATYAGYWIKQSIRRAVLNQGEMVRMPVYLATLLTRWWRATAILRQRLGREPFPDEVGVSLGLSRKRLKIVTQAIEVKKMMSPPEPSHVDEISLEDVADRQSPGADEMMFEADDLDSILRGLDRLDERHAAVIRLRFGLGTDGPLTVTAAAEQLGLSRESVRRLQDESLRRLIEVTRLDRKSDTRATRVPAA